MFIRLTQQQQRTLDEMHSGPARLVDPRSNEVYVLLPLAEYEAMLAIFENETRQRAIRAVALRNARDRALRTP